MALEIIQASKLVSSLWEKLLSEKESYSTQLAAIGGLKIECLL